MLLIFRFNTKTVCEISLQVLNSLQYIHHQGYVHKDVKVSVLKVFYVKKIVMNYFEVKSSVAN